MRETWAWHPRAAMQRHLSTAAQRTPRSSRFGAPGEIRTRDLEIRRLLLYPAELQGLTRRERVDKKTPRSLWGPLAWGE